MGVDLHPKYKGKITVPDNPIQIADAALYLKATAVARDQGSVRAELDAVQRGGQPAEEAEAADQAVLGVRRTRSTFKNGDAVIGASWPYQTNTLLVAKAPVKDSIPQEGATGWLDTWMVSAKTKNLECAYKWLA